MKSIARCLFLYIYLFLLMHLACESVSFRIATTCTLTQKNLQEAQYLLDIDDAFLIKVEEELSLLKGVDIEVSQGIAKPLSFFLYSMLQPASENGRRHTVKELMAEEMNSKKIFVFRCAYDEKVKFSPDATIKMLPCYLNEKTLPLLFKFSQIKDDTNEERKVNIKIKPILQDIGGIKFNFLYPSAPSFYNTLQKKTETDDNHSLAVRLDDKYIKDFSKPFFTKVGQHKIQVESPLYKSEVITCVVEKGKTEIVEVQLKPMCPLLVIEGANIALVYLDDVLIKLPFYSNVPNGEHTLKIRMDDYEMVRSINLEDGKTYNLSLSLELKMEEH